VRSGVAIDIEDSPEIAPGIERYEGYFSKVLKTLRVEYAYRDDDGAFFITNAPSLDIARARRDAWLASRRET